MSVLDGGFAAAHAWVARDCDHLSLSEVLVDYDEESSLFADLEKSYQSQKEFSTASARRKTTLAMQKLIDNSMVRLTNAESQIEDFTDRFISARNQTKANASVEEDDEAEASNETGTIEIEAHDDKSNPSTGTRSFKIAFAGMRKTNQKEKEDKEVETKAFDLSRISFGNGKQKSKANEGSITPEEKDNFEQTRFDFGKITFARGARNPFTKPKTKISKEDAALEQEIEASLSPPEDTKVNYEKRKSNVQPKVDDKKPDSSDQKANFKGVFKKNPFSKFGSFKKNIKPKNESGALREEEAILFDEDD